jgi:hypothetical protein
MLQTLWRKYFCCCYQNQVEVPSIVSNNIVLTSCEQVWPPIPVNWKHICSSYTNNFDSYDCQNKENDDKIFMVVLFLDKKNMSMYQERIDHLRNIIDVVSMFYEINECIDYLAKTTNYLFFPFQKTKYYRLFKI